MFGAAQGQAGGAGGFGGFGGAKLGGAAQTPAPTGFGQQQTTTPGGFGGFKVGGKTATTGFGQTPGAPAGGGLFGGASTTPGAPAGGGLFGGASTTPGFGGFGGAAKPATATTGGFGGFGATTPATGGLFGNQTPGAGLGGGGLFGQTQQQGQQQLGGGMFGQTQQQIGDPLTNKLAEIQSFWDPMVPVLAVGFDDIKKRIAQQESVSNIHKAKLEELSDQLDKIERKHYLETTVKLEEYKRRHVELAHRVLKIMKYVEVLRNKGYPIRAEEEALRGRLEAMDTQLKKPAHFRGRVQELQATLRLLKDSRRITTLGDSREGNGVGMEYTFVDEQQMTLIGEALSTAQEGLKNLSAVIEEDQKDLSIIMKGYAENLNYKKTF
ncbi:hypothetical protein HDV05_003087 [Chytridiales sp. JEL 0842]|nr:hypothetical protein HDV05_003087 [Chytridiales sp. JEL 0842]